MSDPGGEAPKPRRTVDDQARLVKVLIVAGLIITGLWLVFGQGDDNDASSSADVDVPSVRQITYHVTGSARSVDITIETPTGTSQQSGLSVPLTSRAGDRGLTFTFDNGAFVYISAQNNGESGTVRCSIEQETGLTISENTSSGAYAIATCEGSA